MKVANNMKPSTSCIQEAESNNAFLSSTTGSCKHTMSHDHHVVPVKQQEILHDFPFFQGRFGIPCVGKVCHCSPRMNYVSLPIEKSALLPMTLAQLACQDFKKEPPDSYAAVQSPQSPYALHNLHQLNFGSIIGAEISLWTSHGSGGLHASPKSLAQNDCHSFRIKHLGSLAASMLCSNALVTTFPVTNFLAVSVSISLKLPVLKATVGEPQKLDT